MLTLSFTATTKLKDNTAKAMEEARKELHDQLISAAVEIKTGSIVTAPKISIDIQLDDSEDVAAPVAKKAAKSADIDPVLAGLLKSREDKIIAKAAKASLKGAIAKPLLAPAKSKAAAKPEANDLLANSWTAAEEEDRAALRGTSTSGEDFTAENEELFEAVFADLKKTTKSQAIIRTLIENTNSMKIADIARACDMGAADVSSWFQATAKRVPQIVKSGAAEWKFDRTITK